MNALKCHAIVLRSAPYGDYDKMVTLLTSEYGVLDAGARGCRSTRKRELLACTEVFTYGEYLIKGSHGRKYIEQCTIQEAFLPLRQDALLFAHAAFLLDCVRTLANTGQENQILLVELLHALIQLNYGKANASDMMLCYLLRILRATGFEPALSQCARCGAVQQSYTAFSPAMGGVICDACKIQSVTAQRIAPSTPPVMRQLLKMEHRELSRARFEPWLRRELMQLLPCYAEHRLERPIKSLPVLLSMIQNETA